MNIPYASLFALAILFPRVADASAEGFASPEDDPGSGLDTGLSPSDAGALDPGSLEPADFFDGRLAIINGDAATAEDWPNTGGLIVQMDMVVMGQSYDYQTFICSSTLIAPDVVLAAAHCVDERVMEATIEAQLGVQATVTFQEFQWSRQADLTDWDGSSFSSGAWPDDAVAASEWVPHPDFSYMNMGLGLSLNYDIGLVFLEEAVTDVDAAYIITEDEQDQVVVGAEVEIVGWGQQTSGAATPGSYAVKMGGTSVINEVADYEIQIGSSPDDTRKCHGDSGGPTFLDVETDALETQRIIGVTSHSYDLSDCNSKGGVDTRVDYYRDWIDEEMTVRCEDGSRVWCDVYGIVPPPYPSADTADTADTGAGGEGGGNGNGGGGDDGTGCSCANSGSAPLSALPWLGLLAPLALVRRRRS